MLTYLPDTNVLIDFGRHPRVEKKLYSLANGGSTFVLGPPSITELVCGVVRTGSKHFSNDQRIFKWLQAQNYPVLELPLPFVGRILGIPLRKGNVAPQHYSELIELMANSNDFHDFLQRKDKTVWHDIDKTVQIHSEVLDKEFASLVKLAREPKPVDLARRWVEKMFPDSSSRPDPKLFRDKFSAAIEYIECTLQKIRSSKAANPRKNDAGFYVDSQFFFYLADQNINFLTKENFTNEIRFSPQRTRIVPLNSARP